MEALFTRKAIGYVVGITSFFFNLVLFFVSASYFYETLATREINPGDQYWGYVEEIYREYELTTRIYILDCCSQWITAIGFIIGIKIASSGLMVPFFVANTIGAFVPFIIISIRAYGFDQELIMQDIFDKIFFMIFFLPLLYIIGINIKDAFTGDAAREIKEKSQSQIEIVHGFSYEILGVIIAISHMILDLILLLYGYYLIQNLFSCKENLTFNNILLAYGALHFIAAMLFLFGIEMRKSTLIFPLLLVSIGDVFIPSLEFYLRTSTDMFESTNYQMFNKEMLNFELASFFLSTAGLIFVAYIVFLNFIKQI